MEAFTLITECEAAIHGTTLERVHLHEVGSVDAILDIVGAIWGLEQLGVERVYCGTLPLGDGFVDTQHGRMAVPTAATLKLLEGLPVRPGPEGSGELVTPTGAALVRVLSAGAAPAGFTPVASGFGAGTKDFPNRANALRVVLADVASAAGDARHETLYVVAADLDDATGEELGLLAESARKAGALDVTLMQTIMKKGRPGVRVECLVEPALVSTLEDLLLMESSTIGVRVSPVERRALAREVRTVEVLGREVRVKVVTLPDGSRRAKAEADDLARVASDTGRTLGAVRAMVAAAVGDSE